jgi:hypothetical protein
MKVFILQTFYKRDRTNSRTTVDEEGGVKKSLEYSVAISPLSLSLSPTVDSDILGNGVVFAV